MKDTEKSFKSFITLIRRAAIFHAQVGATALDSPTAQGGRFCLEPHLADEETQVPRREVVGVRAQNRYVSDPGPGSGLQSPRWPSSPMLLRTKCPGGASAVLGST